MLEGTTDNVTGSGAAAATTGNITSGTASEAMIKAATAASSAETAKPSGTGTGDPPKEAGAGNTGATLDATGQPPKVDSSGSATGDRGPIPFDRHEAALKNARTESIQQYKWAQELQDQGLNPDEVKAGVSLLMRLRKDPAAFWKQLGSEVQAGVTEEETFDIPGADLESPDGKVKAYSEGAHQKSLEVMEKKILSQFKKEMKPLIEFYGSEMTTRQQADFDAKAKKVGDAALKRAESFPHFKENKVAIAQKLAAMPADVVDEIGPIAAMFEAYNQMLQEKVFPSIETDAEKRVREDFQKKANAGGVHPAGGGGDTKKVEITGVSALAAHMEKLAAQGVGG